MQIFGGVILKKSFGTIYYLRWSTWLLPQRKNLEALHANVRK